MKFLRVFAVAPLVLLSASTFAAGNDYVYFGAGNVQYNVPGAEDQKAYENPSITIGGGHYFAEHFAVEGFYRYSNSEDAAETFSLDSHQLGLSLLATTGRLWDTPFELFARGTGAYTIFKDKDISDGRRKSIGDDASAQFDIGGGIQWDMNADYWMRAEYVYSLTMHDIEYYGDMDYKGVQVSIGRSF